MSGWRDFFGWKLHYIVRIRRSFKGNAFECCLVLKMNGRWMMIFSVKILWELASPFERWSEDAWWDFFEKKKLKIRWLFSWAWIYGRASGRLDSCLPVGVDNKDISHLRLILKGRSYLHRRTLLGGNLFTSASMLCLDDFPAQKRQWNRKHPRIVI